MLHSFRHRAFERLPQPLSVVLLAKPLSYTRARNTTPAARMTQPKITLYISPGSCSIAPHIMLREVGATFDLVKLSTKAGLPDDFARINPKKRVPVLVLGEGDEQEIITENPAILTAIAQLAPEKQLLGKTDLETARAYEWMSYLSGTLHGQGFGGLWRPARFTDDPASYDSIRAKGRKTIEECFEIVESKLTSNHAVGHDFSVVDALLYVFWRWGCETGVLMERFEKYAALAREVAKRKAAKTALEVEGIPSRVAGIEGGEKANM